MQVLMSMKMVDNPASRLSPFGVKILCYRRLRPLKPLLYHPKSKKTYLSTP